ncbi:type II toxin-antitoxin system PemK/MazF family toxin [Nostoc sp. FACHB-152]|uniref:type II toxin-antitoxin system PemK/MazF family toxin n=1 Tax=unclassified Nostoc TaxID=2593658 RepID=UPI0016872B41|nr:MULTISPECIES: type II toxin-antitoxin system PemK/MazF family toxin [unclassified Nostoc]MBD2449626.1 type II toxin-antitoxin system PemK/MazF family toxin [Nostoc sp. FACHB-152]MBD2468993.1 type II toxin-antitoxin system PemK/MazF family toxin [Nostoc sp. FACHB-145]
MVASSYFPDRGDIVKLEFGSAQQFTADSIRRAFTLHASGMPFDDIARTLNNELQQQGREQIGYRPVLVISPLQYNRMASLVLVCPITSNSKGLNFEVPLGEGMQTKGVILSDQIKTLDWRARKVRFVEKISQDLLEEVQARLETLIF